MPSGWHGFSRHAALNAWWSMRPVCGSTGAHAGRRRIRSMLAWGQGDRHVWSVVRVPNVDEEDLRRSHRERDRLVRERTAHINRIKGLLFGQGIRSINVKSKYKTLQIDKLVTGDGRPLPPRLASEITREIARLALIQEQIATLERE